MRVYNGWESEISDLHLKQKFEHSDDMMKNCNFYFLDKDNNKVYYTKEYIKNNMSLEEFQNFVSSLSEEELVEFEKYQKSWQFLARTSQRIPPIWHDCLLFLGGRGSGKTRAGAEWTVEMCISGLYSRVNILGPTMSDVENTMLNGPSGILTICRERGIKVEWKKTDEMLVWPNGTVTLLFSAEKPERLRGVNSSKFWIDEVVAFEKDPQILYDMLILGLRLDDYPSICISTTPKNNDNKLAQKFLRKIVLDEDSITIKWKSTDNDALPSATIKKWNKLYAGTKFGAQELEADLNMEDTDLSAVFSKVFIDKNRLEKLPDGVIITKKIVAIDPSVSNNEGSDECGLVVAGLGSDNIAYLIEDFSGRMSSKDWGSIAVKAYYQYNCDLIIAETNNGGDLVENVIENIDSEVEFKQVKAIGSKMQRATPIGLLYEQGRVSHLGTFEELEEQMCNFDPLNSKKSPDRMDALVWAITELIINSDVDAEEWLKQFRKAYTDLDLLTSSKNVRFNNNNLIQDEAFYDELLIMLKEESGLDFDEMLDRKI